MKTTADQATAVSSIPFVVPVDEPRLAPDSSSSQALAILGWPFAWAWRVLWGVLFCTNYFSSILVVGWLYRWQQGLVLRGWWRQSPRRGPSSFATFSASLGHDAPTTRPRWFWQQRPLDALTRPTADGQPAPLWRQLFRLFRWPLQSFWQNLSVGVLGLFCTYLLTGWGCLLMPTSWEFGWLNSFHKGYEIAPAGAILGFTGIFLFVAALFYVPMAQVHQAVTGDPRAFFHFRFLWLLIQAKPASYVCLAAITALASLPLEILKTMPYYFSQLNLERDSMSNAEVLQMYQRFRFFAAGWLFATLLVTHAFSAWIYRGAVLKVLAEGWLSRTELHPTLKNWLQHLDLLPTPPTEPSPTSAGMGSGLWWVLGLVNLLFGLVAFFALFANVVGTLVVLVVWAGLWLVGGVIYLAISQRFKHYFRVQVWSFSFSFLTLIWFLFVAKTYVGEFLHYHPVLGFLNHPLIQLPCLDLVESRLHEPTDPWLSAQQGE